MLTHLGHIPCTIINKQSHWPTLSKESTMGTEPTAPDNELVPEIITVKYVIGDD